MLFHYRNVTQIPQKKCKYTGGPQCLKHLLLKTYVCQDAQSSECVDGRLTYKPTGETALTFQWKYMLQRTKLASYFVLADVTLIVTHQSLEQSLEQYWLQS